MKLSPAAATEIGSWLDEQQPPEIMDPPHPGQRSATDLVLDRCHTLSKRVKGSDVAINSSSDTLLSMIEHLATKRRVQGTEKYGHEVVSFNGRSAKIDALQEAIDLAVYTAQMVLEDPCDEHEQMLKGAVMMVHSLVWICCKAYLEDCRGE